MNLLNDVEVDDKGMELNIKEYIRYLNIDNTKLHLSEDEFNSILSLHVAQGEMSSLTRKCNIKLYKMTIDKFPTVRAWENAKVEDKIIYYPTYRITNVRYYQIMLICMRIKGDWNVISKQGYKIPNILTTEEKSSIFDSFKAARYSETGFKFICNQFIKIMLTTGKELYQIDEQDIYKYREFHHDGKGNKELFNIAKRIASVPAILNYKVKQIDLKENNVENENMEIRNIYFDYIERVNNTQVKSTANDSKYVSRLFVDWLWDNYSHLQSYMELNIDYIEEFVYWNRLRISTVTNRIRTATMVNGELSKLKGFLKYLKRRELINYEIKVFISGSNCDFDNLRSRSSMIRPLPVPITDRIAIEKIINNMDESTGYLYIKKNMFKLMYLLALRPSEVISLKWDCIKGTKEILNLHVHRAKGFKERYIPLILEAIDIIKELQQFSKDAVPIYKEWDGEIAKRLFAYNDSVINIHALEVEFNKLLILNGLVNIDNRPKYTLYVLRKIRITTWLEFGISEYTVAELVGHGDLESLSHYIISKEVRIKNASKVFYTFYDDLLIQIKEKGFYENNDNAIEIEKDYAEELIKDLTEIENKNINVVALEMAFNQFPELMLPLPCGNCLALILNDESFECEKMKIPCLECSDLKVDETHIIIFDNFIKKNKSRKLHQKEKLEGLVNRANAILERLLKFYQVKFEFSKGVVDIRFKQLFNEVFPKRGRKGVKK